MTLTTLLAERALRPVDAAGADHLRMLTATNMAAGRGRLGRSAAFVRYFPAASECRPAEAAQLAAVVLHARTQDDFYPHGRVHVGAITLAATLALADDAGDELLDCLAAGYEVMCLASGACSPYAQRRGLRPSGVFGPLGAAASAARALGLDERGVANAVGLAAAMAGGTNQAWLSGTDEWMFVVAQAARTGVEAALLTQTGVTASEEALEGPAGWGAAYFGDPGLDGLRAALDDECSRVGVVAAKLYPVSGIAQLAAHLACAAHEPGAPAPSAVEVRLAEPETRYPGTMHAGPFRSRADALMSVPFTVACGLTHGLIRLDHLEAPADAGVHDLLPRITVEADSSLAEAESVLVVRRDGQAPVETKLGEDVMFPSWDQMRADPAALARRSEAPAAAVEACCAALTEQRCNARVLKRLLLEDL